MNVHKGIRLFAILSISFLVGCAAVSRQPDSVMERYPNEPWKYYLDLATDLESQGEYQRALAYLLMAESVHSEDPAIRERIDALKTSRTVTAEKRFQKGLIAFQKEQLPTARQHFLIALAYDPDHSQALAYLRKTVTSRNTSATYTITRKETAATISEALWNNYELDFLLYYFNDKTPQETFKAGESIQYPLFSKKLLPRERVVSIKPFSPPSDVPAQLLRADQYLAAEKFKSALKVVQLVKLYEPDNVSADRLKDEICYQYGRDLKRKKKYQESYGMLSQVTHGYKGVERLMAEVKIALKEQAEAHYRSGVRHFLKEELKLAISDWEAALLLNPDHPTARKDLESARKLLEKLGELE